MKASIPLIVSFAISTAAVSAVESPNGRALAPADGEILNYALTIEHLQDKFYREGLANYTPGEFTKAGFQDSVYANLKEISSGETEHVRFLTNALKTAGVTPVAECAYNFSSTDPRSFVALSSVLEGVGVSAYLGILANIVDPEHLEASGSILSVKGRYSAYLRAVLGNRQFPSPFDAPLDPDEVYSLASSFILECPPPSPRLSLKAFPELVLSTSGNVVAGGTITLNTPGYTIKPKNGTLALHAGFITATGLVFQNVTPQDDGYIVKVPFGIAGQNYVVLTRINETVSDDTVVAGPAIIEVTN